MIGAIMAGASALGSMFGDSGGAPSGGSSPFGAASSLLPSLDSGTQTSSSGSTDAKGGAGWLVQHSVFTVNSGRSTMEESGNSDFGATQLYTPRTSLSSDATTSPTNAIAKDGGTLSQIMPSSFPEIPANYLYIGAALLVVLVLIIAIPTPRKK